MINNIKEQRPKQHLKECRICLSEEGELIVPCKCIGSVKYVHEKCIRQWTITNLQKNKQNNQQPSCQICKAKLDYTSTTKLQCYQCSKIKKTIKKSKQLFFVLIFLFVSSISGICLLSYMYMNRNSKYNQGRNSWAWVVVLTCLIVAILVLLKSIYQLFFYFFQFSEEIINIHHIERDDQNKIIQKNQPKSFQIKSQNTTFQLFTLKQNAQLQLQKKEQIKICPQNLIIQIDDDFLQEEAQERVQKGSNQ